MEKLKKDGKVAILYSPGFGAGWSTWNSEYAEQLIFDKEIAEAVLNENNKLAIAIAEKKYPDIYTGGGGGLTIMWIDEGEQFEITEYDGSEGVNIISQQSYFSA